MMIVGRPVNGSAFYRIPLAGKLSTVPDDEKFLDLLWHHISVAPKGVDFSLSAETHLALLQMAGVAEGIAP